MLTLRHRGSVIGGLCIVVALTCIGCRDQQTQQRIDGLTASLVEQRAEIDTLKLQVASAESEITNTRVLIADMARSGENMVAMLNQYISRMETLADQLERTPTNKVRTVRVYVPTPPTHTSPVPAAQSTRMGVPQSVYNQIATDASAKWPGNYEMQKFVIDEQVAAWLSLHR